MSQDLKYKK